MKRDIDMLKEILGGVIGLIGLLFWLWLFWITGYMVIPPAKPSPVYEVTCWKEYSVPATYGEDGSASFRVAGCEPGKEVE